MFIQYHSSTLTDNQRGTQFLLAESLLRVTSGDMFQQVSILLVTPRTTSRDCSLSSMHGRMVVWMVYAQETGEWMNARMYSSIECMHAFVH